MSLHLLQSEREDETRKTSRMACEDHGRIGFMSVFECMVGKNLKTPKLSSMVDNAITRGGIGGLGSLMYICGARTGTYYGITTIFKVG